MWGVKNETATANVATTKAVTAKMVTALVVMVVAVIAGLTFSAGYGAGHSAICQQEHLAELAKHYPTSHIDVIYERTLSGKQDFLHLEIDTTYHKIGKGNYTREVLCSREFSLREFDVSYRDCGDVVAQCFVEGNASRKWESGEATKSIAGNKCYRAVTDSESKQWEAWYTTTLPHIAEGARVADHYAGLILEARDAKGEYELKAKYITQYIG